MRRPVYADGDADVVLLKAIKPAFVDEHAVCGCPHPDRAASLVRHAAALVGKRLEIRSSPKQRFAAMQDHIELRQRVESDLLLDPHQQSMLHRAATLTTRFHTIPGVP